MSEGKNRPTAEDVEQLGAMLRKMREASREAVEFKPGELTPEEEQFVAREGLNRLSYIPQRTIQRHADPDRRSEAEKAADDMQRALSNRFDGFGYGMFLLFILGLTWLIIDAHGWPMGTFSCLLMLAVLELSYRLSLR